MTHQISNWLRFWFWLFHCQPDSAWANEFGISSWAGVQLLEGAAISQQLLATGLIWAEHTNQSPPNPVCLFLCFVDFCYCQWKHRATVTLVASPPPCEPQSQSVSAGRITELAGAVTMEFVGPTHQHISRRGFSHAIQRQPHAQSRRKTFKNVALVNYTEITEFHF